MNSVRSGCSKKNLNKIIQGSRAKLKSIVSFSVIGGLQNKMKVEKRLSSNSQAMDSASVKP